MSINLLRGGGGGGGQGAAVARRLLLRHLTRSPAPESLSRPFVRSRLFSNGLKESPVAPSLSVPSSRASSTTTRNAFVTWYLGRIEARPVLTKSLTAGAIFVAADISSQVYASIYHSEEFTSMIWFHFYLRYLLFGLADLDLNRFS